MQKQISIPYTVSIDSSSALILLFYTMERTDNMLSISCYVEGGYPADIGWLQLRTFNLRAILSRGKYDLLFDDYVDARNHDTIAFTELAYEWIMKKEKLKTTSALAVAA